MKECKKCGATGDVFKSGRGICKQCTNEGSRLRMEVFRQTPKYREWLKSSAENRKRLKAKYRRNAGATSKAEIIARSADRAMASDAEKEQQRLAKELFLSEFVGPPKPSRKLLGEAIYFKWRYMNDAEFHMRELDRAQDYKARTRIGYKGSIVKWQDTPTALKELKHLHYLLTHEIERKQNENDQRIET